MKQINFSKILQILGFIGLNFSSYANIVTGNFFTVIGNGNPINVNIKLCLNGYGAISCQQFPVSGEQLNITPNTNNNYQYASIEVLSDALKITSECKDTVSGRCIIDLSNNSGFTVSLGSTPNKNYIFITSESYQGNLGGLVGADNLCQNAADNSGNALLSLRVFKALLISSTRYPCDSTGECNVSNYHDWVLNANQYYYSPYNFPLAYSNENAVLTQPSNSNIILYDEHGDAYTRAGNVHFTSPYFWSGIMSIKISDTDPYNIVGWAYENVNPDSINYWSSELSTCSDWTSSSNAYSGSEGLSDSFPLMWKTENGQEIQITDGANDRLGQWGNYYYFTDNSYIYYTNTWLWSDRVSCDNNLPIVCVSVNN